jgi:BirA family biotin operon repressor/biotin-[acetyl-CoA-carboxylase] ligase
VADSLAPHVVEPLLRGRFGRPYRYAELCPSTQRLLLPDDPEGAVAAAEEQSEGRGRLGRKWHAPRRTAVLFSLLLRPPVPPPLLPELSLVAGRAVAEALAAEVDIAPTVKAPNDVLVDGRKVAGILAEAADGRVVLGIGVNANQTAEQLPRGTAMPPTSLLVATGRRSDRAALLARILERLELGYDEWVTLTGSVASG